MSRRAKLIKVVLPVSILVISFALMILMVFLRRAPQKEVKENPGVLIQVITAYKENHQVVVAGTGTVHSRREASITPQVSGKVSFVTDRFVAGGFFKKGDLLFAIEKVDYELAVERANASLAQAELELAQEESNARIARLEWERLSIKNTEEPNPLVLYEPQLKKARANVASAKATRKQAQLDLDRTRLYAPFNCRVRKEEVALGQHIRSGTNVALVAGTDHAEIIVPLSFDEMHWLKIPRHGSTIQGSSATVRIMSGYTSYSWEGKVVRSLGEVDEKGRMARVVVSVTDPYRLSMKRTNGEPDLEVGTFVEVDMFGEKLADVVMLPRGAVREGNTVWIADDQNMLRIRPVKILRSEKENVIIQGGLSDGDQVVLTKIQGAADGMKLRPLEGEVR